MKVGFLGVAAIASVLLTWNSNPHDVCAAPTEVKMDRALKGKLDTFFSNFSEVYVEPFAKGKTSNKALISFGIRHNEINKPERVQTVHGSSALDQRIAAKLIEPSVEWYFGRKITKHESVPGYAYKNGYYYWPGADGEGPTFSQITKLMDLGNNLFRANVNTYSAANGWEGNTHGTVSEWKRADDGSGVPELTGKMTATIKKVGSGSKQHYILVEYLEAK